MRSRVITLLAIGAVCIIMPFLINQYEDWKNRPQKISNGIDANHDISWIYGDWTDEEGLHFCVLESGKGRVVLYDFSLHGTVTKYNSGKVLDVFYDSFHIENGIIYLVNDGIKMKDSPKMNVDYQNQCLRTYDTGMRLSKYTYFPAM